MNKKLIPISIIIAALLIVGTLLFINQEKIKEIIGSKLSADVAAEKAIKYINENLVASGIVASLINVSDAGSVYKIHLKVEREGNSLGEFDSYVTKDGIFLFTEGYNMQESFVRSAEDETKDQKEISLSDQQLESLAKCLTEKGAKFYGTRWCSWCARQKEIFGNAAQYLPYVECSEQDSQKITAECQALKISSFPTWEFNGEKKPGFKNLEDLINLSGCSI